MTDAETIDLMTKVLAYYGLQYPEDDKAFNCLQRIYPKTYKAAIKSVMSEHS